MNVDKTTLCKVQVQFSRKHGLSEFGLRLIYRTGDADDISALSHQTVSILHLAIPMYVDYVCGSHSQNY